MSERDPSEPADPNAASRRGRVLLILAVVALVLLVVGGVYGFGWWTHGRFVQGTNDAYLQADQVTVSPKVQGYVDQVLVRDNQDVTVGQPLVRIDASNYDASLAQQQAALSARQADIQAAQDQVAQQAAAITQARAQLAGAEATAAYAAGEAARYDRLSAQGVETQEKAAQARNQRDQAAATAKADAAALAQANRQAATLGAQVSQAQAQLAAAQAQVTAAEINRNDTLLRASIAGRVGDRTVQVGQFVQPGARLMTIVPVEKVYLVANFKETQIGRMRVGQPAKVRIDAFGRTIDAVVDSFAPGTGSQFALLPPENATGNFTKIVQRVPVKLRLIVPDDLRGRLLPGLSVTASVDTSKPPRAGS